ncbi:hypothetical protein Tco_1190800 [Tanacetum coccineum]
MFNFMMVIVEMLEVVGWKFMDCGSGDGDGVGALVSFWRFVSMSWKLLEIMVVMHYEWEMLEELQLMEMVIVVVYCPHFERGQC